MDGGLRHHSWFNLLLLESCDFSSAELNGYISSQLKGELNRYWRTEAVVRLSSWSSGPDLNSCGASNGVTKSDSVVWIWRKLRTVFLKPSEEDATEVARIAFMDYLVPVEAKWKLCPYCWCRLNSSRTVLGLWSCLWSSWTTEGANHRVCSSLLSEEMVLLHI